MNLYTENTTAEQKTEVREWLKGHLRFGEVTIIFKKVDGTLRTMRCTTCPELLPPAPEPIEGQEVSVKKERKENPDVARVYDLDKKDWRSFRFDSVTEVQFSIGE